MSKDKNPPPPQTPLPPPNEPDPSTPPGGPNPPIIPAVVWGGGTLLPAPGTEEHQKAVRENWEHEREMYKAGQAAHNPRQAHDLATGYKR